MWRLFYAFFLTSSLYAQSDYDPFHQIKQLESTLRAYHHKKIQTNSEKHVIQRIKINLERWRRLLTDIGPKYIIVNIPTYILYAVSNGQINLSQKIIVGKRSRQTPLFTSNMTRVIFNPSWTVPPTIFKQDKLPRIISDPGYLSRSGYIVRDQEGKRRDPYSIKWSLRSPSLYSIQLVPGKSNPLGPIKFDLNNSKAIFLHGTSQKKLFNASSRALSSGCVRVENPVELAVWAIEDISESDVLDRIYQEVTTSVGLKAKIPVIFSYITVWVDQLDRLIVAEDPYGLDYKQIKSKPYTYFED